MKALVAFGLLCVVAVHAQQTDTQPNQPRQNPTQPGVQPFQPFQFPTSTGFPYGYPQNPQFQNPQFQIPQPTAVYSIVNSIGRRCVAGIVEYASIVRGQADYDFTTQLVDCPPETMNQRTFTTREMTVYVVKDAGSPTGLCTFDQSLFIQLAESVLPLQAVPPGALFTCPPDGNLNTGNIGLGQQPLQNPYGNPVSPVGYNPYGATPFAGQGFNPYGSTFGRYPGFGQFGAMTQPGRMYAKKK